MTAILFKLIPWGTLISLLFTWLAGKFGSGFMKWVLELVAENASKIDLGQMSKIGAEARNIELIQKATANSPGINTSEAKLINTVAYLKWLSDNKPMEFKKRMGRFLFSASRLHTFNYSTSDFMKLYTSPPDRGGIK